MKADRGNIRGGRKIKKGGKRSRAESLQDVVLCAFKLKSQSRKVCSLKGNQRALLRHCLENHE